MKNVFARQCETSYI